MSTRVELLPLDDILTLPIRQHIHDLTSVSKLRIHTGIHIDNSSHFEYIGHGLNRESDDLNLEQRSESMRTFLGSC